MESRQHIGGDTDLSTVFGELGDAEAAVREHLASCDTLVAELRERLAQHSGKLWETDGLVLEELPSGQASIQAEIREGDGTLWFTAELRPRNYFSEHNPWRPGQPPRPMQTDAWNVDGTAHVMVRRKVVNKKYNIEESAAEIEERSYSSSAEAAAGLLSVLDELSTLALSREATVEAWAPPGTHDP
jgi:hypothetical protein